MSLNQRVTAEFSTCTPSAPPTADLSIQTIRKFVTSSAFRSPSFEKKLPFTFHLREDDFVQ
jgi:hypothetical protein